MCHPFFAILPSDVSCYIADAYYTQESYESLNTVDDFPELAEIQVPPNQYVCARNNGARRNVRNGSGGAGGTGKRRSNTLSLAKGSGAPPSSYLPVPCAPGQPRGGREGADVGVPEALLAFVRDAFAESLERVVDVY